MKKTKVAKGISFPITMLAKMRKKPGSSNAPNPIGIKKKVYRKYPSLNPKRK